MCLTSTQLHEKFSLSSVKFTSLVYCQSMRIEKPGEHYQRAWHCGKYVMPSQESNTGVGLIFSLCNKLLQLTKTVANTRNSALQIAIQQCSATSCTGNVEHITSLLKVPVPSLSQIFTVESCEAVAILINRSNRRNLKHSNAIFEYYIITSVYFVNSCMIDWLCRCMTSC